MGDFGKLIVPKGFIRLPKVKKLLNLVTLDQNVWTTNIQPVS